MPTPNLWQREHAGRFSEGPLCTIHYSLARCTQLNHAKGGNNHKGARQKALAPNRHRYALRLRAPLGCAPCANVVRCLPRWPHTPAATFVASSDDPGAELILTATTCHHDTVRLPTVPSLSVKCNAKPTNCGPSADKTAFGPPTFLFILIACMGYGHDGWEILKSMVVVCLSIEHPLEQWLSALRAEKVNLEI